MKKYIKKIIIRFVLFIRTVIAEDDFTKKQEEIKKEKDLMQQRVEQYKMEELGNITDSIRRKPVTCLLMDKDGECINLLKAVKSIIKVNYTNETLVYTVIVDGKTNQQVRIPLSEKEIQERYVDEEVIDEMKFIRHLFENRCFMKEGYQKLQRQAMWDLYQGFEVQYLMYPENVEFSIVHGVLSLFKSMYKNNLSIKLRKIFYDVPFLETDRFTEAQMNSALSFIATIEAVKKEKTDIVPVPDFLKKYKMSGYDTAEPEIEGLEKADDSVTEA